MSKIVLPSISIMVTEACSLKCKLCLAYVPYYKKHLHMNLKDVKMILNNLFKIVDKVEKISITGGEPLLNPELNSIMQEILKYSDRVLKEIIIITNGTFKIADDLLEIFKTEDKIKVIVNNYGKLSKFAEENYEKLYREGINTILYTENNRYGWIDCRNHDLKHTTEEACRRQSARCEFFKGKKYVINRGVLYTCTRAAYRIQENIIDYTEESFIDLLDSSKSIEEQQKKLENLLNAKTTISCAYCDGLTETSKKYRAAEQL